jgi:hypothetical protein
MINDGETGTITAVGTCGGTEVRSKITTDGCPGIVI